ncbi:hypothetical protein ES705_28171 [subsurface metagenome]
MDNIAPGKNEWFDGHQEMEQALVRFGRFVNDMEGNGKGDTYIDLARFLLDNRGGGSEYDQTHVPVTAEWREDLLEGIMTIKGKWADESPLLAIPYYARNNRDLPVKEENKTATSRVWIKRNQE